MTHVVVEGQNQKFSAGLASGKSLYGIAKCGEGALYLNRDGKLDIPVMPDDFIVIHGGESFVVGKAGAVEDNPPLRNPVCPEFNGGKLSLDKAKILAKDLVAKDDKFPQGRLFADFKDAVDAEIKGDMRLIVQGKDSYFVVPAGEQSDEYVDVEECGKNDRRPPKTHKYRIRVDGKKYTVDTMTITGAAILALVGKSVSEWELNEKLKGGKREPIKPDESIDLSRHGIERFETVPKTRTQGSSDNQSALSSEETEYLNANYSRWDALPTDGTKSGVVISGFLLPTGYTAKQADLLIIIPQGYPGTKLDMFYFDPPLQKANGHAIDAASVITHFNRSWQQWSRHHNEQWNSGVDDIVFHIEYVKRELETEVVK